MGRYYALHDGEDRAVADALADHYKPLGPNDSCPTAPVTIVVALADKIDALAAFFAIGEPPTGSRDPFALRRAALGIVRLILENELRLPVLQCFLHGAEFFVRPDEARIVANDLFNFILERLTVYLRGEGFPYDVINTCLYSGDLPADPPVRTMGGMEQDFTRLVRRADALRHFLASDDGANLLTAYRRASNIVAIEERKGDWRLGEVDANSFRQPEEHALFADLNLVSAGAGHSLAREEFQAAMGHLAAMRRSVDAFFDAVTVNTDDARLRENRLRLLSRIRAVMNQVADFSQIEG